MRKIVGILLVIGAGLLAGCTVEPQEEEQEEQIGHQEFYDQVAPTKYPPTDNIVIFEYKNVDLRELYEILYSDYLTIGKSSFVGPYEDPEQSRNYAKSIGSDIFITSSQFKETRTSFKNESVPTSNTTYFSGYSGGGRYHGSATTYSTRTEIVTVRTDRYSQRGIYLRNLNNIVPLWKRVRSQYRKTVDNPTEGVWANEIYEIELFQSGGQMVAFIKGEPQDRDAWADGQLKMLYGFESGVGVYLMGNKKPMPAKFSVNKFGHLEVNLVTRDQTFSFAKK